MGSITKFAALNTKIRVFEGQLLGQEDYEKLIKAKDLHEMLVYLKNNTVYRDVIQSTEDVLLDALEGRFNRFLIHRYETIYKYVHMDYRKIFNVLLMRYEIEDIKQYIQQLHRNEDVSTLHNNCLLTARHRRVDYKRLSQVGSLEAFVEALKKTEYYKILKHSLGLDNTVFYMTMNLQIHYFKRLQREMKKKLGHKRRGNVLEILGKNSDLLNIQWIYRGKKFYNLSPEELLNYVLLTGYYFDYQQLKEFCYIKTTDRLIEAFRQTKYGFLFTGEKDFEMLMERNVERYIYSLFKQLLKNSSMDINKSIAYMHQLEYEINDLFSIMEAKRYRFDAEVIKQFLVRQMKGGD